MSPESVKKVVIVPLISHAINGNVIIVPDNIQRNTDSNSTLIIKNLAPGFAYQVTFTGNSFATSLTNYFGTNVSGSVNGKDYLTNSGNLYNGF